MTSELKKLPSATKRNRTELTIWNGLEFGIGFWIASVAVLMFGVPMIMCAIFIVLSILGVSLGSLGN